MIIVKLQGGLGNQLFQYALGRRVALERGEKLLFDTLYFQYVRNRRAVLSDFQVDGRAAGIQDFPLFFPATLPFVGKKYLRLYSALSRNLQYVCERQEYTFDSMIFRLPGNLYLDGFWQHPSYTRSILPLLRKEFMPKHGFSETIEAMRKNMEDARSVSVHVRRSDYMVNTTFGTCSIAYYEEAFRRINAIVKNPSYYVFSDDLEWARRNITFEKHVKYVDSGSEITDFSLMRSCSHHIIANSTYSWWAATLGSQDGLVIAPTPWVRKSGNWKDLYSKKWIIL